jgi:hypothetical protein
MVGKYATAMVFTVEELETLRVALLSAHYSAMDEERALRDGLEYGGLSPAARERGEESRAKAALRAHAYHLLVERVMAERQKLPM